MTLVKLSVVSQRGSVTICFVFADVLFPRFPRLRHPHDTEPPIVTSRIGLPCCIFSDIAAALLLTSEPAFVAAALHWDQLGSHTTPGVAGSVALPS